MKRPWLTLFSVLALAVLLASSSGQAQAQTAYDIAGNWTATVLGQTVTATFNRDGNLINGVVVIPDPAGGSNTYHMAGTYLNGNFAALHGSGHLLKGTVTGPNDAQAVFTPKNGPTLTLNLKRQR